MIQCFHSGFCSLQEDPRLVSLLVQKLNLDDGRKVFLQETALFAGLLLRRIRGLPQPAVEVPPEHKEKRHQGKGHASELEIQHKHRRNNKDRVECCLQSIGHKAGSEFGYLIDILFHSVELFSDRCGLVEVRRETVDLLQNAEANAED